MSSSPVPLRQGTHVVPRVPSRARLAAPSQGIRATKRWFNSEGRWLVRGSAAAPWGGNGGAGHQDPHVVSLLVSDRLNPHSLKPGSSEVPLYDRSPSTLMPASAVRKSTC